MELWLAGDSAGFPQICPKVLGRERENHLISYGHNRGKESIDDYIKGVKDMELFFAGLGFMESNLFTFEEKYDRLLSYINEKNMIEQFITLLKGEGMDLYLVGPEKDIILNEVINKDKNNMLISYDNPPLIDKEKKRFKKDMDLYLAGEEPFGKETQDKVKKAGPKGLLFSFIKSSDANRAIKNNSEKVSKLFIDSGAFSAWTKGKTIDVDKYIKFINDRSEYIYLYGQVDSIPGNRVGGVITPEMVREAAQKTWENYLYMRPKMKNPDGLLYTFHVGEPFEFLKQALEWTDENGKHIPYIALGGMVGKPRDTRESFLEKCFKIITESSNPNVKVHAFGMTDFDLLSRYPITSADSTSWIMSGANGMIKTDFGSLLISDKQKDDPQHYSHLPIEAQQKINEEIEEFGFTLEDLKDSRDNRIILNAKYMMKKAKNLVQKEYKPKKRLF